MPLPGAAASTALPRATFMLPLPGRRKDESIVAPDSGGIAVALVAISGASWWNVVLGIWTILSPPALGFANVPILLWNNIIVGVLVFIVAVSARSARRAKYGAPPPG